MKTFRDLAEYVLNEVKFKRVKKWKPDKKGMLKKVIVKQCLDSDGQVVKGYKVVNGKSCEKISPDEVMKNKKRSKKINKTKKRNQSKLKLRAKIIKRRREAKGL